MRNKKLLENEIVLSNNPKSAFSESIKSIMTNLQFSDLDGNKKIILMTSSLPHEGKSFITANLAASFANNGNKVLIIDCDLRKGRQHRIFGLKNNQRKGYSNMILNSNKGEFEPNDYIKKTSVKNLELISTGKLPPSPTELLSSPNNERLLEYLKGQYDYIFLDCPPVIGLSDALLLSKMADYNVVVTASNETKIEDLLETKAAFEKANSKITGVILNKVTRISSSYYGYYGYYTE